MCLEAATLLAVRLSARPPLDTPVEQALVELLRESRGVAPSHAPCTDAWRQAALREGVDASEPEPGYALSPRSTRGATRA
jgi:hypothetical protein